jgi:hypothetical protein
MSKTGFELKTLPTGVTLHFDTSDGKEVYSYHFLVTKPGEEPTGELSMLSPNGTFVEPQPMRLRGSGRWTTPAQNPVQIGSPAWGIPRQELALSIWYGQMELGSLAVIAQVDNPREFAHIKQPLTSFSVSPAQA